MRLAHGRRWTTVALAVVAGVAIPIRVLATQTPTRWWPSSSEADASTLSLFGNAIHCTPGRCDPATSIGIDTRLAGRFRVAADARVRGFDYGASYGWRSIGVATTIGRGTSLARVRVPRMVQTVRFFTDSLNRLTSDTTMSPVDDSSASDATRWSSAEARLTWREDRWWATAIVGRFAVASQGAALWTGVQLGADIARGASLLIGLATTSRLLTYAAPESERHRVSLGLGFNTSILSSRGNGPSASVPAEATAAFTLSRIAAGRSRITIRVPSAHSVEFASDCTGWKPLDMTLTRDGWVVDVAASAGVHRANIRVDGGKWIAPPGLSSAADEFAGEVGIFVVQ